ncbi:MAG TPA: hypothetical protein GXZ30_11155 [Propionibacterium sp.]|jgi:hypothetical protein|nr:hypothetical protein [Propionibacterium sp.]
MSSDAQLRLEAIQADAVEGPESETPDYGPPPSEWESALLTICMFGGLVIFGIGCLLFGWS